MQGFRKIDPDIWEFANEAFIRGQKHLLKNIKRKKAPPQTPQEVLDTCVEGGGSGLDGEVERLKHEKQVLLMELLKLRHQQQNTRAHLQSMELRLQGTEKNQHQMMRFLARAMQNPTFTHQLVQQMEKRKELEESISRKRWRPIDQSHRGFEIGESSRNAAQSVKFEPPEFGDYYGFQVSELEALALEMQGFGRVSSEQEEDLRESEKFVSGDRELDEGFWEELLNERFDEELGATGNEEGEEEDVTAPADRMGFLGYCPK